MNHSKVVLSLILTGFGFLPSPSIAQPPAQAITFSVLKVHHNYTCHGKYKTVPAFYQVSGTKVSARTLRIDLVSNQSESEALIPEAVAGKLNKDEIKIIDTTGCIGTVLSAEVISEKVDQYQLIAYQNAPFIGLRPDQTKNHRDDLPLLMGYSFYHQGKEKTIKLRYTVIFSDENDDATTVGADRLARYGRANDIEYVYDVIFDSSWKVIDRRFHGSLANSGIGDWDSQFDGMYLNDTKHAVLMNEPWIHKNTMMASTYKNMQNLIGHHLVPRHQLLGSQAREWLQVKNPWVYQVCYGEQCSEKKADESDPVNPLDQLYVLVEGTLKGEVNFSLTFQSTDKSINGMSFQSASKSSSLDRLGEDLFGKQSFVAIQVSESILNRVLTSKVTQIKVDSTADFESNYLILNKPLRFFRLLNRNEKWMFEEITSRFQM